MKAKTLPTSICVPCTVLCCAVRLAPAKRGRFAVKQLNERTMYYMCRPACLAAHTPTAPKNRIGTDRLAKTRRA